MSTSLRRPQTVLHHGQCSSDGGIDAKDRPAQARSGEASRLKACKLGVREASFRADGTPDLLSCLADLEGALGASAEHDPSGIGRERL